MARTVRDANLQTRAAREKLRARKKPYWRTIDQGRHLGYYRGDRGGTWISRKFLGKGRYEERRLGTADDTQDANGADVLSFAQAQEAARTWFDSKVVPAAVASPYTVSQALDEYLAYLRTHKSRTSAEDAERRVKTVIRPQLGTKLVRELQQEDVETWLAGLVRNGGDAEDKRRSKDSANRVLTMLRAALNLAYGSADKRKKYGLTSADAWREVKRFHDVGRAREIHLDPAQCQRLINATSGALRNLVTAVLLTGARPAPGEVAAAKVRDFDAKTRTLHVDNSKTGPRDIVLTSEGVAFFKSLAAGKHPDALLLPKDDGSEWKTGNHTPEMRAASKRAGLPAGTSMYSLRHSYASQSILAGMSLKLLAENMGTSIRMLEEHYAKFIAASRAKLIEEAAPKFGLEIDTNVRSL